MFFVFTHTTRRLLKFSAAQSIKPVFPASVIPSVNTFGRWPSRPAGVRLTREPRAVRSIHLSNCLYELFTWLGGWIWIHYSLLQLSERTLWEMTAEMITGFMRCNMHDLTELCTSIYHSISLYSWTIFPYPAPEALNGEQTTAETKGGPYQKYPLQLILNVLHARECRHSLDHFHEDASDTPGKQTNSTDSLTFRKWNCNLCQICAWISESEQLLMLRSWTLWTAWKYRNELDCCVTVTACEHNNNNNKTQTHTHNKITKTFN